MAVNDDVFNHLFFFYIDEKGVFDWEFSVTGAKFFLNCDKVSHMLLYNFIALYLYL